jgi:hypothetical protein
VAKPLAIAALAILLLTVGALLLVHRLTEYQPTPRTAAERAAASAASAPPDLPVYAQPPADYSGQGPGQPIVIPAGPLVGGPVQNETAPIQGPPPVALPEDAEEGGAAISNIRKGRVNEQMERINRRNQQRLGQQPNQPPPPPPNP